MKRIGLLLAVLAIASFGALNAQSKSKNTETTVISLDMYCCSDMDETIERILAYERGVKSFELRGKDKEVSVEYMPKRTNPDKIAKSLAREGVMANGIEANPRGIERLPDCCRDTAKGLQSGCGHDHDH